MSKFMIVLVILLSMITQNVMASDTNRCELEAMQFVAAAEYRDKKIYTKEEVMKFVEFVENSYGQTLAGSALRVAYHYPKFSGKQLAAMYLKACNKRQGK